MNGYFNQNEFKKEKKSGSELPKWVWILAALGLILAVFSGHSSGVSAVDIYRQIINEIIIEDTNGDDTSLTVLDFSGFIGVFDGQSDYNFFDCDISHALGYDSTVRYDYSKGVYPNDFAGSDTVNYTVSFKMLNYYDISYAKRSEKDLTFTFTSALEGGNLEARIFRIDSNYRVKENEYGTNIIEDAYVSEAARFSANTESTVALPGGYIYILAVGGESASGSYSLKVE